MTILVTGGAGYIGSQTIIQILKTTDWEVVSVDNYATSTEETYQRIEQITGKKITYYKVDLTRAEALHDIFEKHPDLTGIIHFAAHKWVGESVENPQKYYNNNLNSLINVLNCQRDFDVPFLVFSSSCSVYGNVKEMPVTENTPLSRAESPYAHTKQLSEGIIQHFIESGQGQKALSLRYFNPVGADMSGLNGEIQIQPNNLVPFITAAAIGRIECLRVYGNDYNTPDGTCVRDYIHVVDIANAHVAALKRLAEDSSFPPYDVINLGTGNGVSVLEAIQAFEKVSGVTLNYKVGPRREGDVEAIYANNNKAKTLLNWEAQLSVEEMMDSAWRWEQLLSVR